jgi:hypothetical protein
MVCGSAPQVRRLLYSGDAADLKQIGREFRFSDLAHVWRQRPETIDPNFHRISRVDRDRAGLRGRTHDAIWRARREAEPRCDLRPKESFRRPNSGTAARQARFTCS